MALSCFRSGAHPSQETGLREPEKSKEESRSICVPQKPPWHTRAASQKTKILTQDRIIIAITLKKSFIFWSHQATPSDVSPTRQAATRAAHADSRQVRGPKLYSYTQFLNVIFHSYLPQTGFSTHAEQGSAALLSEEGCSVRPGVMGLQAGACLPS